LREELTAIAMANSPFSRFIRRFMAIGKGQWTIDNEKSI
jgi:hypothetical protein